MITLHWTRIIEDKPQCELRYELSDFAEIITERIFTALQKDVELQKGYSITQDEAKAILSVAYFVELLPVQMKGVVVNGKFVFRAAIDEKGFYFIDSFKGLVPFENGRQL